MLFFERFSFPLTGPIWTIFNEGMDFPHLWRRLYPGLLDNVSAVSDGLNRWTGSMEHSTWLWWVWSRDVMSEDGANPTSCSVISGSDSKLRRDFSVGFFPAFLDNALWFKRLVPKRRSGIVQPLAETSKIWVMVHRADKIMNSTDPSTQPTRLKIVARLTTPARKTLCCAVRSRGLLQSALIQVQLCQTSRFKLASLHQMCKRARSIPARRVFGCLAVAQRFPMAPGVQMTHVSICRAWRVLRRVLVRLAHASYSNSKTYRRAG